MSRVNVEGIAFSDPRFARLASLLGLADADHARGKMEHIWFACTIRGELEVPAWVVEQHLGERGPVALIESELARWGRGRGDSNTRRMYICGARGRTEWYSRNQEQSPKGGKVRAASASRVAGRFAQGVAGDSTSAPAPAPAPAHTDPATASAVPDVTSGLIEIKEKTRKHAADRAAKIPDRAWKAADYLRERVIVDDPNALVSREPWGDEIRSGWRLKWADEIRLMVERDKRTYEQIAEVLRYVFTEQTGDARFIVQSADALREKWDRIQAVRRNATAKPAQRILQIPIARGGQS